MIRDFRLSPPGSGRGVSCAANGACIGSVPLLKRSSDQDRWEPRDCGSLSKQIGSQFGLPIDMSSKMGGLKAISNALNKGDIARAQIATVLLGIPDPPPLSKGDRSRNDLIKFIRDLHWSGMIKADWDSDEHPRWPAGTPYSQGGQFAPKSDSEDCGRNAPVRRLWEKVKGIKWPVDAQGRRYDVHHIKPRADGGTDDLDNIEPKQHDEHIREHMENGDFRRWGLQGSMNRKSKKKGEPPASQDETGNKPEDVDPATSTTEPSQPPKASQTKPKSQNDAAENAAEEAAIERALAEDAIAGLFLDY